MRNVVDTSTTLRLHLLSGNGCHVEHLAFITMATTTTAKPWNGWFGFYQHNDQRLVHPQSNRQLPAECVADCSGSGDVEDSVEFWVDRLSFDGPSWLFREQLKEYGCWGTADLADHSENRKRVLWLWACDCRENPGDHDYLWLGI